MKKSLKLIILTIFLLTIVSCRTTFTETKRTYQVKFVDESGNLIIARTVFFNELIGDLPNHENAGVIVSSWIDQAGTLVDESTAVTKDLTISPKTYLITELYFKLDKTNKVVEASKNINYEFDPKDKNYNYFYITPKAGYLFSLDIIINVTYTDNSGSVFIGKTIKEDYIEYIIDDPGWSKPY